MSEGGHWLLDRDALVRRRLDGRTIVELGHSLVHQQGSAAFSMRALAAELGTSTSGLYRHIRSKQWLLVAIADYVLADVDTTSALARRRPRARLHALATSYRNVLRTHPHLHEILTSQVMLTPNSMRIAEAALACLRDEGIPDHDLVDAYNAWCGYVIGFSVLETKPPEHAPDPSLRRTMRRQLERADPNAFPILSTMREAVADRAYGLRWQGDRLGDGSSSFEWGLAALLDGFERRATPKRGSKGRGR